MSPTVDRLRDPQQRQERARRILDVAAALLLRHGYRRVTIDDVAVGADIGKGTIYLHWKTREALFTAVFEREVHQAIGELVGALRQDLNDLTTEWTGASLRPGAATSMSVQPDRRRRGDPRPHLLELAAAAAGRCGGED